MWYTSEHYFQTQKFHDLTIQKKILKTRSAAEVVRIAGNPKLRVRRDWDAVKLGVMRTAVRTKFTQITDLTSNSQSFARLTSNSQSHGHLE